MVFRLSLTVPLVLGFVTGVVFAFLGVYLYSTVEDRSKFVTWCFFLYSKNHG